MTKNIVVFWFFLTKTLFFILFVTGCKSQKPTFFGKTHYDIPGMILLSDNFFCDKAEVDNCAWREYRFWLKDVYGEYSSEYQSAMPDTACWSNIDSRLAGFGSVYYSSDAYCFYPVVGISCSQARQYSKWRSDRIMERHLVHKFGYEYQVNPTKDNCFTIDRYFNNELEFYPLKEKVVLYPELRLPRLEEFNSIILNPKNKQTIDNIVSAERVENTMNRNGVVMESGFEGYKKNRLVHILGNVQEWTDEESKAFGGSWKDPIRKILKNNSSNSSTINAWTGFRNVGSWNMRTP